MGNLATDTAVTSENGHYRATLSPEWDIWGPNGGYVAAIALRAAGAHVPHRRPATFACHYLNVGRFAPVDLHVATLRESKRTAAVRVSMTQAERPLVEAIVWVVAEGNAGLEHDVARMPDVPRPETLKPIEELEPPDQEAPFPFWGNLESRPIDWVPHEEHTPSPPEWREWYRFRPQATFDDPFVDAARSLVLLDTMMWPAAWKAHAPQEEYIAPNIDLNVQFHRAAPESAWLLCDAAAPVGAHGLIGTRSAVWSQDGRLLASGAGQLLCRRAPQPT